MKTYKNSYRGFTIVINEVNEDRVEFNVERKDGTIVEDSEGFCVTIEQANDNCKEIINDILGLNE